MAFLEPAYDSLIVDAAGDTLIGLPEGLSTLEACGCDCLDVVNNWRAAHAYPLNTFQMTLRNRTRRLDPEGIVAQRIKRLSSIEDKLKRYRDLKLSDVQDIAGCRVIVSTVDHVYQLVNGYKQQYRGHILDDEDDYIRKPKPSGYRGYHLIYRYEDRKHAAYSGLKIEMQLRSNLQHCWATAVETVDIFLSEGLKSSRGSREWQRFFALMSSAIALQERCRVIPRTPKHEAELISELRGYAESLDVQTKLAAFGRTIRVIGDVSTRRRFKYIVVVLDLNAKTTELYGYTAGALVDATDRYAYLERHKAPGSDAVLVAVSDAANLQRAYPNYFLDTTVFLDTLSRAIS